ncbi:MAG: hypothetical protein ISR42_03760 [Acidimicrobiia bacterium]|nr:hypothetical protein [Acidimicrobiia bacterium]
MAAVTSGNTAVLNCLVELFGFPRVMAFSSSRPTSAEMQEIEVCLPILGIEIPETPDSAPTTTAPPTATTGPFAPLAATCPPEEPLPGGLSEQVLDVAGRQREYSLYVPASHDPFQPTPLVFILHGRGYSRNVGWWGFQPLADNDGWILVYPQGLAPAVDNPFVGGLIPEIPQWNFKIMGADIDSKYSDMDFFAAIREDLALRTCVDAGRVFATGNSAGGYMSSEIACRLVPEFAAVAPVGGLLPPSRCNNDTPTPINVFYGKLDETNPYGGAIWRAGVEESMASWADRNGCGEYSSTTIGATTRTEWECPDGSDTVLYAASDAGHTWPGLEDIVDEDGNVIHDWVPPINRDFSATEVIWEFLGNQSRG